ncbi:NADP-dependent oxidoreductase [Nonomuraea basaltis]|uniref:NADP-dependent oxidoreductase n=1 Tax=Nonomuraea basaltis TaxID=2495887 RepID=UPI00110C6F2C|nr:NADP-dependent oxidoreductase [Nonomuraea basaltis]TMR97940.1 NADP-dependent oxidoreductase [Nonomuraea basaltis]
MKALVAPAYGPVDELRISEVPDRSPGPGQVLVRVQAAALNPFDVKLVTGELREMYPVRHPFVLGMDATGVVSAVGEGVSRFAVGDEVIAYAGADSGTIAEYVLVGEGPQLVHRPRALPPVQAAALPTVAMTAHCVLAAAALKPGDTVLVIGATGGVGALVVRRAAESGVRVLATAAPADTAYIRGLGAHETIDHTRGDTPAEARQLHPGGLDAVVDLINAGPALVPTAGIVRPGGRLVSTLYGPAEMDGVVPVYVRMEASIGDLPRQAERAAADLMSIEVAATYPFDHSQQAMRDLAAGRYTRGKIVITF